MKVRGISGLVLVLLLAACSTLQRAYVVPIETPAAALRAKVWVDPHPGFGVGEWIFWFDTILWPVDSIVSLAYLLRPPADTRFSNPFGAILAIPLPLLTNFDCRSVDLAGAVLGLHRERSVDYPLRIRAGITTAEIRSVLVDELCKASSGRLSRVDIERRIVEIEWPESR